jgi:predicted ABC-type ATPase
MRLFDWLRTVVAKTNPYHDTMGRFSSANEAAHVIQGDVNPKTGMTYAQTVREGRIRAKRPTAAIQTPERQAMRNRWVQRYRDEIGTRYGEPVRGRQATFVLGLPGVGKSTIIDPMMAKAPALRGDNDAIKAMIPEYDGGVGAMQVHEEASMVLRAVTKDAIQRGENVVLETVGAHYGALRGKIKAFLANGYTIHVQAVTVESHRIAQSRARARFVSGGRVVPMHLIRQYQKGITKTLEELRHDPSIASIHVWDNSVQGRQPVSLWQRGDVAKSVGAAGVDGRRPRRPRSAAVDAGGRDLSGGDPRRVPRVRGHSDRLVPRASAADVHAIRRAPTLAVALANNAVEKTAEEQRLVIGWASVISDALGQPIVDSQGDVMDEGELLKAAHAFMSDHRSLGDSHRRIDGIGTIVESLVLTSSVKQALGLPASTPTGWLIAAKVDDEAAWQRVKSGEYGAFSIGGTGTREAL